jgi:hypothetical protein
MYDDALFSGVYGQLAERCQRPFGMLTLEQRQARLCADLVSGMAQAGKLDMRANEKLWGSMILELVIVGAIWLLM